MYIQEIAKSNNEMQTKKEISTLPTLYIYIHEKRKLLRYICKIINSL